MDRFRHLFSLCLFKKEEIFPFLEDFKREHPDIDSRITSAQGTLQIALFSDRPFESLAKCFEEKFPTYVFHEQKIEQAVHHAMIRAQKTLGLAESCTGGALAARLTALPNCSTYFRGSVVAYSNDWKERFLHVAPSTLKEHGAVSRETIQAMLEGLFGATDVDYAIAISGIAGPSGGTTQLPQGTIFIGIGKRGERSDIGVIHAAPCDRLSAIDCAVQTALSALWRRVVHQAVTFS